jgi:integrase
MTFNEALTRWIDSQCLPGRWAPKTQHLRGLQIPVWRLVLGGLELADVRPPDVLRLVSKITMKYSISYGVSHRVAFKQFWGWTAAMGWTTHDPTKVWTRPKCPKKRRPIRLPEEYLDRICRHLLPIETALCRFAFVTGLRWGTLTALEGHEVHELAGPAPWLEIAPEKMKVLRSEPFTIGLSARAAEILRGLPIERDRRVFAGLLGYYAVRKHLRAAIVAAGLAEELRGFSFHGFRKGFATRLLDNGVDVRTIMDLGAWASPQMILSHYAATAHRDQQRAAVDRAFHQEGPSLPQ